MFNIGDKVVPYSKSIGCSWDNAEEWKKALNKGQNFLYITKIELNNRFWCAYKSDDGSSEYFHACDLKPYVEEKNEENGLSLDFVGAKLSKYKVKDILDLVNKGILKEEDDIILGRK